MKQSFTSANTSINKDKLPAIYGKLDKLGIHDCSIIDYGCGRYTSHIDMWCSLRNIRYYPYDKFNKPESVNHESIESAKSDYLSGENVIAVCSNVLNVIDSDDVVQGIVNELKTFSNVAYVTIYEGDKSGIGRQTGKDMYQRNEKLKDYARFAPMATFKNGMMIL